jgi:WGR domain
MPQPADTLLLILHHRSAKTCPARAFCRTESAASDTLVRDVMPKRRKPGPERPAPIQLPLFAEAASLIRVRSERNEFRYYRMEIWPDLFGRALLLRQWGRIGALVHELTIGCALDTVGCDWSGWQD